MHSGSLGIIYFSYVATIYLNEIDEIPAVLALKSIP